MKSSIIAACVLLAGCASVPDIVLKTPADVKAMTVTTADPYTKNTAIDGPKIDLVPPAGNWYQGDYRLRVQDATHADACQLRVTYWRSDWAFLEAAHDSAGAALPVTVIDRQVDSGAHTNEYLAVSLSRAYLEAHRATGLDIRIDGTRGSALVKVPAEYVAGFLSALPPVN